MCEIVDTIGALVTIFMWLMFHPISSSLLQQERIPRNPSGLRFFCQQKKDDKRGFDMRPMADIQSPAFRIPPKGD
jgi:hypothetical protein